MQSVNTAHATSDQLPIASTEGTAVPSTTVTQENPPRIEAPGFDDADMLLLDEARDRFSFEQKSAAALHSKATFFFGVTAAFAALIAGFLGRPVETTSFLSLDVAIRATFVLSLACLCTCAVRLANSVLSRSYQVIATPKLWIDHLDRLRRDYPTQADILARLRRDVLDGWAEAADICYLTNEAKAAGLEGVAKILRLAILFAGAAVAMQVLGIMTGSIGVR